MTMFFVIVAVVFIVPFVVYMSVKLGTVAWFRGRQIFHELENRNDEDK